jgi:DNA repair exonuclease SbcCD ATPase subunit
VLWFFVCAGLVLLGAGAYAALHGYTGIVAGEKTAWIVGACYALLGLSVMGTTWWMKEHFETIDFSTPETGVERKTLEHELLRIEQTLERIARREAAALPAAPGPEAVAAPLPTEDELIRQVRQQLLELDRLEPAQARLETLRLRLSQWREQLQDRQRRVAQALLRERDARSEREEQQRQELAAWQRQVRDLAERIEGRGFVIGNLYEQLARWEEELRQLDERRRERARLRQTVREHRREAAQLVEKIERMRKQRIGLLKRLGVADRGEIAVKLAAIDERKTIEHQLKGIREEIFKLAAAEPELAIVEEDLIRYDAGDNQAAIDELRREQTASETALQTAFETLGTLKRQVREIEEDRTLTSLRFDREQAAHALREAVEQWCAIKVADRVLDQLRHRIEQDRQPRLLLAASDYLQRFTCGKYRKIWTRLGEKALLVDDDQGQSLRVEHLSSGTREQVFLSVRLALIRDFARQGTELPLVLDDVTVNFDQTRTEAAVQTLAEVAAQGQQIVLLTCHQHLAQLFEQRGVEPIWLPNRRGDVPLQRSA